MPGLALHCNSVLHSWGLRFLRPGRHDVKRCHLYEGAALLVLLVLQQHTSFEEGSRLSSMNMYCSIDVPPRYTKASISTFF